MSGKPLNIPDAELMAFVPPYGGKSKCATEIYRMLTAAGFTVRVRPGNRRKNEESDNPYKGRVAALSFRLSRMRGVESEQKIHKSGSRTKCFWRE